MAKKFDLSEAIAATVSESGTNREQITYIDEASIVGDAGNFYSLDGVEDLAANIELIGLQQPLRVRPDPDNEGGYIVVSGHRRLTAIRQYCKKDNPELWRTVPCIIEQGNVSQAMQELRLIYANSDTRRMSNADISKQAERVESLLYQLQEEGMEFPGRMRDRVAEICKISKSKLARLSYIRDHLAQDFSYLWEKNKLPESCAYELAHFEPDFQQRLAKIFKDGKGIPVAENIAKLCEIVKGGASYEPEMTCPSGKTCTHGDAFLRHDACAGSWESKCKGNICCLECDAATRDWSPCQRMCSEAAKRRSEKKAKEDAKAKAASKKAEEEKFNKLRSTCERMVRAADAAGLDDKVKANDGYYSDAGHEIGLLRRYARGEFKPDEKPYFIDFELERCGHLARCAQTLRCSTDYLLGLTDVLTPAAQNAAPKMPESWAPIAFVDGHELPPRAGDYYCRFDCSGLEVYRVSYWDDILRKWKFKRGGQTIDAVCLGWYPLPERVAKKEDDA